MRSLRGACAALLLASCQVTGVEPGPGGDVAVQDTTGVGLRDTLTLAAGETSEFHGVEIGFIGIREDSRCPVDVECLWEGNAAAGISVGPSGGRMGPTYQLVLNTSIEPRSGEALATRVTLLDVQPEPVEGVPIPPGSYVVQLAVARVGR